MQKDSSGARKKAKTTKNPTSKKKVTKKKVTKKKVAKKKEVKKTEPKGMVGHLLKVMKDFEFAILSSETDHVIDETPYRIPFSNLALQKITGGILGGKFAEISGGSQCLAKGTLVATLKGPVPIEKIKKGDSIFGYDKNGDVEIARVKETFSNGVKEVVEMCNRHNVFAEATLDHVWSVENTTGSGNVHQQERKLSDIFCSDRLKINKRFVKYSLGSVNELTPTLLVHYLVMGVLGIKA